MPVNEYDVPVATVIETVVVKVQVLFVDSDGVLSIVLLFDEEPSGSQYVPHAYDAILLKNNWLLTFPSPADNTNELIMINETTNNEDTEIKIFFIINEVVKINNTN